MKRNRKKENTLQLVEGVIKGMQEKKGHEIVCLDLSKINQTVCDYFIICHGDSHRQVQALAESIAEQVWKLSGEKPWHREGIQNAEWVLLDYISVVAHVFLKDLRGFYNLEGLWADAEEKKITENGGLSGGKGTRSVVKRKKVSASKAETKRAKSGSARKK